MVNKYFDGVVPNLGETNELDQELINYVNSVGKLIDAKMDDLKVAEAIDCVFEIFNFIMRKMKISSKN